MGTSLEQVKTALCQLSNCWQKLHCIFDTAIEVSCRKENSNSIVLKNLCDVKFHCICEFLAALKNVAMFTLLWWHCFFQHLERGSNGKPNKVDAQNGLSTFIFFTEKEIYPGMHHSKVINSNNRCDICLP
jgi:hypothetical protein